MVVQRTLGGGGGYFGAGLILREGGRREFYISILVGYDNKTVSITEIWRELYWGGGGVILSSQLTFGIFIPPVTVTCTG